MLRREATCECGFRAAGTEEELIPIVQEHGRATHGMEISEAQVVAQLRPLPEMSENPSS